MTARRYKYAKIFRALYSFAGFIYKDLMDCGDFVHLVLQRTTKTAICPKCNRRNKLSDEVYTRIVRDLDLGPKPCYITFYEHKVYCPCGFKGTEKLEFIRPYSRYTIRFEEFVYRLCPHMSLVEVCNITGIDWKTAKDIDIFYTNRQIESLRNMFPTRIGIDEIASEKGYKFLTIIRDLDIGRVIWIGDGRKKETLDSFFAEIGPEKTASIKVIVLDMWDPYLYSIEDQCPNVDIVFDKFHIVKLVTEALDEVRRKQFAKANDEERKNMKKKRFLILKRHDNLDDRQLQMLDALMEKNTPLYKAYLLKEHICDILDGDDFNIARKRFDDWFENVMASEFRPFIRCMNAIKRYFFGVMNYFIHRITNASSEGFNNKINLIKRRAYGFADMEYFKMKIFQSCGVLKPAQ